ncbi:MAG: transporter [Myxococcota bacterium]
MRSPIRLLVLALSLALAGPVFADDGHPHHGKRPDDHAPIGVMGDHRHHAGEVMFSYRYAHMRMSGNRSRTEHQSLGDVFGRGFMIAPKDMDAEMHMIGAMWAPTDRITLMGMLPIVQKRMDHENVAGGRFDTETSGLGDVKLTALIGLFDGETHDLHLNAGVSFPSGSIDEHGTVQTPMGSARVKLPYPMQLGSGSVDVLPGLTYLGRGDDWSWGAQAMGTIRTYQNSERYKLGDRVDLTAWLARPWTSWLSTSARVGWSWWGNIRGADPDLNPFAVPTADPDRRGGWRLEVAPGLNFLLPGGHRIAIEAPLPATQWLYGPQLETDWRLVVGWQKAFKAY